MRFVSVSQTTRRTAPWSSTQLSAYCIVTLIGPDVFSYLAKILPAAEVLWRSMSACIIRGEAEQGLGWLTLSHGMRWSTCSWMCHRQSNRLRSWWGSSQVRFYFISWRLNVMTFSKVTVPIQTQHSHEMCSDRNKVKPVVGETKKTTEREREGGAEERRMDRRQHLCTLDYKFSCYLNPLERTTKEAKAPSVSCKHICFCVRELDFDRTDWTISPVWVVTGWRMHHRAPQEVIPPCSPSPTQTAGLDDADSGDSHSFIYQIDYL